MAKQLNVYEDRLREMIKRRRNIDEVEPWLEAQLEAAAMNWQMVAKLHEELNKSQLLSYENGSSGQTKAVANPLLTMYKEMQRTHIMHMEALGLNFKTLPAKMTESGAKNGIEEGDSLLTYLRVIKESMDAPDQ